MGKKTIHSDHAPAAIGTYSQAVRHGGLVFLSGQIPLDPSTMEVVEGGIEAQVERVFLNLTAVCTAAGGTLDDIIKLNVFLTDMGDFPVVNEVMGRHFNEPYPARAAVAVLALPRAVDVEMEAVMADPLAP
jgi:reactive intermediate/imine deaminase